ncbi:BrnT family toxin [Methylobacterium organophilum]|uniref:BrnT family toxin n=1 Tax=Methylobacterium organophilum TaxID=410 RepID=UPI001F12D061|nr:BrnT family toxin [Methylobacterium organophilum]UMY17873.1 BrnT family toxin [Methylobacterium organophilum]
MGFQWDPEKDAANQAKHLVGFRQAAEIFRGFRLTRPDTRRDDGEDRFIALGVYDNEVLRVVYTLRDGDIRIISAWKASRHDRQAYAQACQARPV